VPLRLTRSEAGFTYIAALVMVVVTGIMLAAIGQSVSVIMQREREKELIFRGLQYRDAIERWSKKTKSPLKDIKDLVEPTVSNNVDRSKDRLLRKLYTDPITGGDFKVLLDPNTKEIYGVASPSNKEPFKADNFPEVIKDFKGKKKYSEWEFVYKRIITLQPGASKPLSFPKSTPEGP